MHDPAPVTEVAEPHTDVPSMTEEPVEIEESFIASPLQPEISPAVLETPVELPSGPDQELSVDLAKSPEVGQTQCCVPQMSPTGHSPPLQVLMAPMPSQRLSPQTNVLTLTPSYLKYQREADHSSLYPAEGPNRASNQNDTPRSEDYNYCQSPRHKMDHLSGCSQL